MPPQSELSAQPTHAPNRQMPVGALQLALDRQATQVPVMSQMGVAPTQAPPQVPPAGPQCEAVTG